MRRVGRDTRKRYDLDALFSVLDFVSAQNELFLDELQMGLSILWL